MDLDLVDMLIKSASYTCIQTSYYPKQKLSKLQYCFLDKSPNDEMDEIVLGYSDIPMTETWLVPHIHILL